MRFLRSALFEVEIAITGEDALVLAEACRMAAENTVLREQAEQHQKLELWQAFFETAALVCALHYNYLLDHTDGLRQFLEELGLDGFVQWPGDARADSESVGRPRIEP